MSLGKKLFNQDAAATRAANEDQNLVIPNNFNTIREKI